MRIAIRWSPSFCFVGLLAATAGTMLPPVSAQDPGALEFIVARAKANGKTRVDMTPSLGRSESPENPAATLRARTVAVGRIQDRAFPSSHSAAWIYSWATLTDVRILHGGRPADVTWCQEMSPPPAVVPEPNLLAIRLVGGEAEIDGVQLVMSTAETAIDWPRGPVLVLVARCSNGVAVLPELGADVFDVDSDGAITYRGRYASSLATLVTSLGTLERLRAFLDGQ